MPKRAGGLEKSKSMRPLSNAMGALLILTHVPSHYTTTTMAYVCTLSGEVSYPQSFLHEPNHLSLYPDYTVLRGFRMNHTDGDFRCWPSYNHQGCLLSVHSVAEAAEFCNSRPQCRNFIMSQQRTWTGT